MARPAVQHRRWFGLGSNLSQLPRIVKIISVVGARPNFMKVAPLHRAFLEVGFGSRIVHTGQHYDRRMSDVFFEQLGLPEPDRYLGVGSGTHAEQTARVMTAFEPVLEDEKPALVVVVGDVNSTLACALVAAKRHVPVAHVEAGLRSGDRRMPEELNRLLTDRLSDFLFVTEPQGVENLLAEGVPEGKIFHVGNVMIDTLVRLREKAARTRVLEELGLGRTPFALMTMHRPANVDGRAGLRELLRLIERVAARVPLVFPMHPRTKDRLDALGWAKRLERIEQLTVTDPMGYLEFLRLMEQAAVVITDSGGIQEETTFLGVPCLTVRENTERPITIEEGTNSLIAFEAERIGARVEEILGEGGAAGRRPALWDGHAAERIVLALQEALVPAVQ